MKYRPLRTGWLIGALIVVAILTALCQVAADNSFHFPQLLWWVPAVLLLAIGLSLAGLLIARFNTWQRDRVGARPSRKRNA